MKTAPSAIELAFGPAHARSAKQIRQVIREGGWRSTTAGLAPSQVQCNLVVLPAADAGDFLRYCQHNPRSCPLIHVGEPGQRVLEALGEDLDIATDVPLYRVFQHGEVVHEVCDISAHWHDQLVPFLLGCSFSFEEPLREAGIVLRHVTQQKNVAMYKTTIETVPAGRFAGPLVVSMRPMRAADAIRAVQVCSRFPLVHGAPVHLGNPALIGIADLQRPDFGDAVDILPDELPVFWACGVTPQVAIERARPAFAITHAPGHMLVTDLKNHQLASF